MKKLQQTYLVRADIEDVFAALTEAHIMEEWTVSPVVMEPVAGGKFALWGGDIFGKNIEVLPNRIVQEWYAGDDWEMPSLVSMELFTAPEGTIIELDHRNIPDEAFDSISECWEKYYLGQVQALFEEDEDEE